MENFHISKISQIDKAKLKDFYFNTFKFEKMYMRTMPGDTD